MSAKKRSFLAGKEFDVSRCTPLGDTIIAEPYDKQTEIGGIIIPVQARKQKTKSIVCAVGPKCEKLKPGDVIFHSEYAGSEASINRKEYVIMHEADFKGDLYGIYNGDTPISIKPFGSKILLEWEQGQKEYKGTKLLRATGPMERHYTGIIIAKGPDAREVELYERVFFDQFCGPERIDYNEKRYAFIHEGDIYCVIPPRTELEVLSQ